MSNRRSPLGWLTKFVVAPVTLAALGYYVVGPRVGGDLKDASKLPGMAHLVAQSKPSSKAPEASNHQFQRGPEPAPAGATVSPGAGPQVDVDVHPTVERPSFAPVEVEKPKPRRKRRKKPTPKPAETAKPAPETPAPTILEPVPPPTDPPGVDQGGSGGAATAGGTGQ